MVDDTCHWSIIAGKLECASVHIADGHQWVSPCNIDNRLRQPFLIRLALVLRSNYAQKLRYYAKNTTRSKTGELRYSGLKGCIHNTIVCQYLYLATQMTKRMVKNYNDIIAVFLLKQNLSPRTLIAGNDIMKLKVS